MLHTCSHPTMQSNNRFSYLSTQLSVPQCSLPIKHQYHLYHIQAATSLTPPSSVSRHSLILAWSRRCCCAPTDAPTVALMAALSPDPVPPCAETCGRTEEIIGRWMATRGCRDKVIIATKARA